jgi:transposase
MMDEAHWFVGIDWASQSHRVCLLAADGRVLGEKDVAHGGDGLAELCDWLTEQTSAAPGQIAAAIETPHGPIVETLLERGFQVYAMNPKQVDRFRDRFSMAGAKDDSRDAHVLADALRTDRHALRRLATEDPVVIELRAWSRLREELREERIRLANRIRDQLWRYYPKALELAGSDIAADWFLDLWEQVPTPARAAQATEKAIADILTAHRIRRINTVEVLRTLAQSPLSVAPGWRTPPAPTFAPLRRACAWSISRPKRRNGKSISCVPSWKPPRRRARRGRAASSAT